MGPRLALIAAILTSSWLVPSTAGTAMPAGAPEDQGDGRIIVKREPGLTAGERADLRRDAGTELVRSLPVPRTEVVEARPGGLEQALRTLAADPDVIYAEPDRPVRALTDDTFFRLQWGLENTGQIVDGAAGVADADVDAPEAWAVTRGAGETVAVVDTGIALAHPDLVDRIGSNPGESDNGLDDDGNGLVDDLRGWDWVDRDATPEDANGHGTHVAGTIAATADNVNGVAGVAPQAAVIPLRVLDANGSGSTSNVIAAFEWAGRAGIPVVNASLGSDYYSRAEQDVIARHPDTLFVVAAGNAGANVDAVPTYPCGLALANVLCVGASTNRETAAAFSNFGAQAVDLFAPGHRIASTYNPTGYGYMDGTSMAAPHAAGAAALVRAAGPASGTAGLKAALLGSTEPKPAYAGRSLTGGRLNAATAIDVAQGNVAPRAFDTIAPAPAPAPSSTPVPPDPPAAFEPAPAPAPAPAPPPAAAPAPASGTAATVPRATLTASRLRLSSRRLARRSVRVTYRLSTAASVKVRLVRGSCRRRCTVSLPTRRGRGGTNSFRVRRASLRAGRYRLQVQAQAGARRSNRLSASLTIAR